MNDTGIPHRQPCLFLGQSACGLSESPDCSFCDTKHYKPPAVMLPATEDFDDNALPQAEGSVF
jgi:hypothetical protein